MDAQYTYPAGNIASKLLIVVNDIIFPNDSIIVIPTTTNKTVQNYKNGCNTRDLFYYLSAGKDFFENNTILQLHTLNGNEPKSKTAFNLLIQRKVLEYKSSLRNDTVVDLLKCIKSKEADIDKDIFALIFYISPSTKPPLFSSS